MQNKNSKVLIILVLLLVASTLFFAWKYTKSQVAIRSLETQVQSQTENTKILLFAQLFMDKVLAGSKEVSFEDRLALENSVRNLNDKEIFDSWQKFTAAKNADEAQQDFYALFQLLLKKMSA